MSVGQRKVPFTGFLEVRQLAEIDRLAKESARPKSEILREAVDKYLNDKMPSLSQERLETALERKEMAFLNRFTPN